MIHGYYVEVEPVILKYLREKGIHVFYFSGGRGIGKTYGAIDMCYKIGTGALKLDPEYDGEKFMYLRRTAVEAQTVASPDSSPFKSYNVNEKVNVTSDFSTKLGYGKFYNYNYSTDEEEEIGYCAALSTFSNLRGIDFSDVSFILYDECIPESKNKKPLKDEGYLLMNMIESINRNRVLEGRQELVLCMLSNPIDLGSGLLSQLKLTPILNNMIFKNQQKYTDTERSLHIEKYVDHAVSNDKKTSFLYKFASDTGFSEQALSGDFTSNDLDLIRKVNLTEYVCELSLENVYVYKHKSKELWYISTVRNTPRLVFSVYEKEKFRTAFYWQYKILVANRLVWYDNYATRTVFESMIKYKPF